ncbi:zinc finger protein 558 [Copidosoma floridanum]|uniref:zinc finger protein 558 n=1 Tax=Copidosoma floridanum TaxID=29053 RepID=UPI0006C97713|nr:zinc finger protein 558 [Copidosoma floridanum]XP_014205810.1 zinc finger protein 558 [Copidosoma floridanum]XP_014205811.1 zinc finger protein 558 [Copidosoma floridanum]XP_023245245.1 zinc finger protein 558 [Copidosoma floridanum]
MEYYLDIQDKNVAEGNEDAQFITMEDGEPYLAMEEESTEEIVLDEKNVIIWDELCRICANSSEHFMPIFNGEGLEHDLHSKIQSYLPFKISQEDSLPLQICYNCAATLISWHDLFKNCLDAQERLTELQNKLNAKEQFCSEQSFENAREEEHCGTVLKIDTDDNEQQIPPQHEKNVEVPDVPEDDRSTREPQFTYMCGVCDQVFPEEFSLIRHLKKEHEANSRCSTNPVRYECNACGKSFTNRINLVSHIRNHEVELPGEEGITKRAKFYIDQEMLFKCPTCERVMANRTSFLRHIRVHSNERPAMCHVCAKSFRTVADVKRHIDDVHLKIKRHECDICQVRFAAKATRDAHRRIHTGEKPFECDMCHKFFRSINLLGAHKRTHTDYRPYPCRYCDKAFRCRQKLETHESIHTGIKPFDCDVCGKLFSAKGEAKRHHRIHFDERPYLCPDCGMSFKLSRYLRTHIRQYHKNQAEQMLKAIDEGSKSSVAKIADG